MNHPAISVRLLAAMFVLGLAPTARAADAKVGALTISHPWSRPTPTSAPTAVGYLTIVNRGKAADRLVSLSSPAADQVQVHSMSMTGGVMRMRPVRGGLPIPAGGSVTLGPNGDHLMFIGLKRPFKAGDHIPVTLTFARAGKARAVLEVGAAGDSMPGMNMGPH